VSCKYILLPKPSKALGNRGRIDNGSGSVLLSANSKMSLSVVRTMYIRGNRAKEGSLEKVLEDDESEELLLN